MAWNGGKNWVRKQPTLGMLELLSTLATCGSQARMCELRKRTGRKGDSLRGTLRTLKRMGLVAESKVREQSQYRPVFVVTEKGRVYV
jgi:predicted transcriptional regulator